MKKYGLFLLLLVWTFLMTACGEEGTTFEAVVLEIRDGSYYLVEPVAGSLELSSADRIVVYTGDLSSADAWPSEGEVEVGDVIEITYSGEIMETDPAQLGEVYGVKVIEKAAD